MKHHDFQPLLAAKKPSDYTQEMFYSKFKFPVLATPKMDGIRCILTEAPGTGLAWPKCRSLKDVPNDHIRQTLSLLPPGLDGEILTYDKDGRLRPFNKVQSDVMTKQGKPNFKFHVFDIAYWFRMGPNECAEKKMTYWDRCGRIALALDQAKDASMVEICAPTKCSNLAELLTLDEAHVQAGFEGTCFRRPDGIYKFGRSTLSEGILIALKRFVDEEARIIGTECLMHNNNPVTYDERGYAERSSHKANMVPMEKLGKLLCRNDRGEFGIGTGFTDADRIDMWARRKSLVGQIVTFKHQPHGAKDLPRIPVFRGIRHADDMPYQAGQFKLNL